MCKLQCILCPGSVHADLIFYACDEHHEYHNELPSVRTTPQKRVAYEILWNKEWKTFPQFVNVWIFRWITSFIIYIKPKSNQLHQLLMGIGRKRKFCTRNETERKRKECEKLIDSEVCNFTKLSFMGKICIRRIKVLRQPVVDGKSNQNLRQLTHHLSPFKLAQ